jgi:HPt (histidine-containing phosphotransfer) domain-containing protein
MNKKFPFIEETDAVMERLGGSETLLAKLLMKFHDNYSGTRETLTGLLESGEYEEAYRIVHSIKGVSANLGISKLYRLAIELEQKMKAGDYGRLSGETQAFLDELEAVVAVLKTAKENQNTK